MANKESEIKMFKSIQEARLTIIEKHSNAQKRQINIIETEKLIELYSECCNLKKELDQLIIDIMYLRGFRVGENKIKTSYFTFGHSHIHKIDGFIYDKDIVVVITDENPGQVMFNMFGRKWAFQYCEKPNMEYFPRGIKVIE